MEPIKLSDLIQQTDSEPLPPQTGSEWENEPEAYRKKLAAYAKHLQGAGEYVITPEQFIEQASRKCGAGEYVIDDSNREIVNQVILYANRDPEFNGDLLKGICICGPIGTGKSLLMKTLGIVMIEKFAIDNIVSLNGYYQQKDVGDIAFNNIRAAYILGKKNHRCCNDLGREYPTVMHMGNTEDIGTRYIYERYELFQDHGIKTYFTTNFEKAQDFIDRYGELNYDRIKEMSNFMFLTGRSRRK